MTHEEARRNLNSLIDFCEQNGFDEFLDDLYSLLDSINEEIDEMKRADNQGD